MKKAFAMLCVLLWFLTVLYPAGVLLSACFGYSFELISVTAFGVVIAALSVCTVVISIVSKETTEKTTIHVLMAILVLLSLANAVFYIFECSKIVVIASMFVSVDCAYYLTLKHGKPMALKITVLVISALLLLPVCFLSFMMATFGNIGQNTVVKTVESPNGQYYAQVIDSDQGALGGDTLVDVYENKGINVFLFKIEKKPHRVYFGAWGEFKDMEIYWKSDNCLVINSVEYKIE